MAMRMMLVCAVLVLGCASSAWPQSSSFYFPRYISQPLSPRSYEACTALREDYDKEASRVSKAHDDCLKANTSTARGDEHGTCSHPRCQGLHDQRDKLSQKRSAAVDQCRNDVAHYLEGKRRDEANRQAAEAERRARESDQRAREARRQDEQQRRDRDTAEAERKRDEQREKKDLLTKAMAVPWAINKATRFKKDPLDASQREAAKYGGRAMQDAVGTALLGDNSRDPQKGSDHKFLLDQADLLNKLRRSKTNPFAYAASEAALRQTGRVQAGALEQWDKATGDFKALDTATPAGANPFASTIRPLPGPGPSTQTAEVAPADVSPTPSRATPPTGEVLAGSSPHRQDGIVPGQAGCR